ncbi:MAG: site-specific integrase [Streptosporangiaceae bacterium]
MARGEVVYFDHGGSECKDRYHRRCAGRWRGEISLGTDGTGRRRRRKVSASSKAELESKMETARKELAEGVKSSPTYTVQDAVDDWLSLGMGDKAAKTITTLTEILAPVTSQLGQAKLRDLTSEDVRKALVKIAQTRATRTVRDTRAALVRAITFAQARGLIARNVASLIKPPPGQLLGRPSRALSANQAFAMMRAAEKDRLNAYVVLSLATGIRTEEARALRWEHVGLDGDPPSLRVWSSVRAHGDTKTLKSRRTLALPERAAQALRAHFELQEKERAHAGQLWTETGLVFTTAFGTALDAANIRRSFRRICKAAGLGENWSPRELRHTFVSIMSEQGIAVEEIARLVGHTGGSGVTERIYRKELRPVLTTGAEVMDRVLQPRRRVVRRRRSAWSD